MAIRLTVFALLLFVSVPACTGPKETFDLAATPKPGRFLVETAVKGESKADYSTKTSSSADVEYAMTVLGGVRDVADDGSYEQTIQVVKYVVRQVADGNVFLEIDTEKNVYSEEILEKVAEKMLEARFAIRFGKDGKATSSTGFEAFSREIDSLGIVDKHRSFLVTLRDETQRTFVEGLSDGNDLRPLQPVGVGQSWPYEQRDRQENWGKYRISGKTRFEALETTPEGEKIAVLRHTRSGKQLVPKSTEYDEWTSLYRDGTFREKSLHHFNIEQGRTDRSECTTERQYRMEYLYKDEAYGKMTGRIRETTWSQVTVTPLPDERRYE